MKIIDLNTEVKWQKTDSRNVPDIRDKILTDIFFPEGLILEIGCAAGNFYERLKRYNKINSYIGVDLDKSQIEKAKNNFSEGNFIYGNILDKKFESYIKKCSSIVCFQVLEHILQDIDLLKKIERNKFFIFSVPNFPYRNNFSGGHKRYYELDGWVERYKNFFEFKEVWIVKHYNKDRKIFIFQGIKI